MIQYSKINFFLSLSVCFIFPSMVAGAAVMELFIILSCIIFLYLNYNKIGLEYYNNKFTYIFFLFCFYLIISSLLSENIFNSLKSSLFYFRFGILILIVTYLSDHYKNFKFFLLISLFLTFGALILFSYFQLFFLKNIIVSDRVSGLFGNESIQGSFIIRLCPIFILMYFYNQNKFSKKLNLLFFLVIIMLFSLVILSGERVAIFINFLMFCLSIIFFKISLKKILYYLMIIFSISFAILNFYEPIKKRLLVHTYNQIFFQEKELVHDTNSKTGLIEKKIKKINFFSDGHQQHIKSAILMFKNYYIKGVGVRNYRIECKKEIYNYIGNQSCTTHPHHTYFQILSETGSIGFIFFSLFIVFILLKSFHFLINVYKKRIEPNIPLGICLIIILANFFPLIPSGSFFNNWLSTLYFIPIGFLMHELKKIK